MEKFIYGIIIISLILFFGIFIPVYIICCFEKNQKYITYREL